MHDDLTPTNTQNLSHLSSLSKSVPIPWMMKTDRDHTGCLGPKSMNLEERLEIWIVAHCLKTNSRGLGVAKLNAIFRKIYTDRRFWQYLNNDNRDYYEDALSLMWRYFFLNLCEATTARKSSSESNLILRIYFFKWMVESSSYRLMRYAFSKIFSPLSFLETRTYAVGRLLTNLKGWLKNIQEQRKKQLGRNEDDALPNSKPELASLQFEAFLKLLETDRRGELNDKDNTLYGRDGAYTLTAQTYLLMYHRDQKTIQQIADELNIPRPSLQGQGGKPEKWKVLARKYAQMAMDSVSE